jgi:ferritin
MLSKKMEKELNNQINAEFWSAFLYLSMTAYFEDKNLSGFANWMNIQYQEESTHALKLFKYINERGGVVKLQKIDEVKTEWKDEIEVFQDTLDHERKVTSLINNLVNIAIEEKDHATNNMLQWFVAEQVEEEANAEEILDQLKLIQGSKHGLLMIDRELKQRTFVDETIEE